MVTALAFKTKVRSPKYKKAKYDIRNVSEKDLSKIIKEFEKIDNCLMRRRGPHMSLLRAIFIKQREIAKCMMRSDNLNWYNHGGYTEMTAPYSTINVTNESESKRSIVNETLSQNCSVKENELCFTKED